MNGTGNDLANVITANDGDDILTGLGGNDILHGGAGIDTAAYRGAQASYGVTWNGATVTVADNRAGSPDGTDTVDHISVLQFSDHKTFLVGGNSHYASIQDAINAASAGDTVLVANGTYTENVTLKAGVNLQGVSQAGTIIDGTVSTPASFDNVTVSNLTVDNGGMLLDMRGTGEVTDSTFHNVTFNLTANVSDPILIGNGQVNGSMALNDVNGDGAGLTFSNVTMNSNDHDFSNSTAFAYTLFHSVGGARMLLDGVSLNGTASGTATGLGAQWNMSPNGGETASVTIENSSTSQGGNFYVSGMDGVSVTGNTFDCQGLALNGVTHATVTNNTFENIDGSLTANGTQHRGLVIENAFGATGSSEILVTGNTFTNITATDGAISFQRFTELPSGLATIDQLNSIDIQGNTFSGLGAGVNPIFLNATAFAAGAVLPAGFTGDQLILGTSGNDTVADNSAGAIAIFGDAGVDSLTGNPVFGAGYGISIVNGHWTVSNGTHTVTLSGVETVTVAGTTYELVDKLGANVGGFQSVQAAIDAAPATGGATILIAPGTYTESAIPTEASATAGGLYINKPDLTLQGVNADGSLITSAADAQADGATIISGAQTDFGSNHFVGVAATNTTIEGLHLQAGPQTNNKLLEIWADNATVKNDFIDVNIGGTTYSGAAAIYFNDNGTTASDNITRYTVDHNILNEGVVVANGVGDPAHGIGANQQITNNEFAGTFDPATGLGRYDTVVINGQVAGIGWLLEPTQTPTISGNTFDNNTTPFLLRGSDNSAANLPTAAEIQTILDNNGDADTTYAYVVQPNGDLRLAVRPAVDVNTGNPILDGQGHQVTFDSFAVTNTIDTLNLALDTGDDNVFFGDQRIYEKSGDTIIVQSGANVPMSSQIMVDNLTVQPTVNSADLTLTLATKFADGTTIPGGVRNLTLGDYAAGQGANVTVIGNNLGDTVTGNSGNTTFTGGTGADTFVTGTNIDSTSTFTGGAGIDTLVYREHISRDDITVENGKWVVSCNVGTDNLNGVEHVTDGTHNFWLVGDGGFATIQEAVDAASAGDTIMIGDGTFAGATVNKALNILGNTFADATASPFGNAPDTIINSGGAGRRPDADRRHRCRCWRQWPGDDRRHRIHRQRHRRERLFDDAAPRSPDLQLFFLAQQHQRRRHGQRRAGPRQHHDWSGPLSAER